MAIAMHHSRARNSTAVAVLVGIANHDGDGGAWPTVNTLAHYARVSPRQAQRAINELVALGEVDRHIQGGGTVEMAPSDRPNLYHFRLKCPPHCDGSRAHRLICEGCGKALPKTSVLDRLHPACKAAREGVTPVTPGDMGGTPRVTPVTPKPSLEPSINYTGENSSKPAYVGNRASARELDASGADLPAPAGASAQAAQAPEIDASGGSHRAAGASAVPEPHNVPSGASSAADGDSETCPRWRGSMPHTPDQHGKCIDCGAPVLAANQATGEAQ